MHYFLGPSWALKLNSYVEIGVLSRRGSVARQLAVKGVRCEYPETEKYARPGDPILRIPFRRKKRQGLLA